MHEHGGFFCKYAVLYKKRQIRRTEKKTRAETCWPSRNRSWGHLTMPHGLVGGGGPRGPAGLRPRVRATWRGGRLYASWAGTGGKGLVHWLGRSWSTRQGGAGALLCSTGRRSRNRAAAAQTPAARGEGARRRPETAEDGEGVGKQVQGRRRRVRAARRV